MTNGFFHPGYPHCINERDLQPQPAPAGPAQMNIWMTQAQQALI